MSEMGTGGAPPREQGMALLRLGKFREAAAALRRAVEADPGDETSWRLLGGALASAGDQAGAVQAFEQAVALAPGSAKNHYNLAVALQATGSAYEAKSHLEQALALDPGYDQARATLDALAKQSLERGYGDPMPTSEETSTSAPAMPRSYMAPPAGDDLAPVGGAGRSGGDDLAPVGGPANAYSPPPTTGGAAGEGTAVPNLQPAPASVPGAYAPPPVLGMNYGRGENTSGMKGPVPVELQGGWNWGAVWFQWLWLMNHGMVAAGVALLVGGIVLSFVPIVNAVASIASLAISIYLGVAGNKLGWQHRRFASVEDFRACQRIWAYWVLGVFLAIVAIVILFAILFPVVLQAVLRPRGTP